MVTNTKLLTGGVKYTVPSIRILVCETNNCILRGSIIDSTTETLGNEYAFTWNEEDLY